MKKSLTIYTQTEEQLNKVKALMLALEISFKENEIKESEIAEKKI
jgi:hypothetical protein